MCACPGWKFHRKGRRKRGERSRGWVVYPCPSLLTSFATCTGGRLIPWRIGGHRDWFVTRHDLRGWPPWNSIVPGAFRHRPPPSSREQKVYISKSTERERERDDWKLEQGFGIGSPSIRGFRSSSRDEEERAEGEEEKSRGRRRVKGVLTRSPRDDLRWKWIDRHHIDGRSAISRLLPRQQAIRAILHRRIITRYTDD